MPTVTATLQHPGQIDPTEAVVDIRLVAAVGGDAPGYYTSGDETIIGRYTPTVSSQGVWSATLVANSLITPSDTVYRITTRAPKWGPVVEFISVPNAAGPYRVEDILTTAPDSLPTSTLGHSALTGLSSDDHTAYALADGTRGEFIRKAVTVSTSSTTPIMLARTTAGSASQELIRLTDVAAHPGPMLSLHHYGSDYGLDVLNWPGAANAIVVHQYSSGGNAAVQIDNTADDPALTIKNTENQVRNPGDYGTGHYFELYGYDGNPGVGNTVSRMAYLTASLEWYAIGATGWTFSNIDTATCIPLTVTSDATANQKAMRITQAAAKTGLEIVHTGNGKALHVDHAATNQYVALFDATYNYGIEIQTATNSGVTLLLDKNGTGAGTVFQIENAGTGLCADFKNATTSMFAITSGGLPQWVTASNVQTTVGAAGGASAAPATPSKWLKIVGDDGVTYVIPAYAAS